MSQPGVSPETAHAGRQSYLGLGMVAASHAVTHMYTALMPIIFPQAMVQLGFSYSQLGLMLGLGNGLSSLFQGAYGFLARRVMRRAILGAGNILLAVSMVLTAVSGGFVSFSAFNIMGRVSYSPQHPVGNSLVSEYFGKKLRGTAFSINFAVANAGTVLVPFLGTLAVAALGWRESLVLFALVPLLAGVLCMTAIPEQRREAGFRPQESPERGRVRAAWGEFLAPLKDRNVFWVVVTATLAAGGRGIGIVMNFVPLYLRQDLQLNTAVYAALYTLLMTGSVAGPLLVGRISDIFGRRRLAVIIYLLSFLSPFALLAASDNISLLVPGVVFMGLVVYSQNSLVQALLADVTGRGNRDMAYSVFFTISYLAGAVWTFVMGLCTDHFGFGGAFTLMAASYLAGALALIPVRAK